MKDEISQRVKSKNVIELLELINEDLENHYKDKLLKVADGSFDSVYSSRFKPSDSKYQIAMEDTAVINKELGLYKVKSSREQPENETCYNTVDFGWILWVSERFRRRSL